MSKAFTREDSPDLPSFVAPRAPLPPGTANYVTDRGLARLIEEREGLLALRAEELTSSGRGARAATLDARLELLEERIATAELVDPATQPRDEVRFGALVTVRAEDESERSYRIVGVDEAEAASGRIAFTAPLARSLLGKRVGDDATIRSPRGAETLEVVGISYDKER